MNQVNKYMVSALLAPVGGTSDMDDDKSMGYLTLNPNNEQEIKQVINDEIKSYFEGRKDAFKNSFKKSLSYFLTTNKVDFGRLYDSKLIAFDHPENPKTFFVWLWEVLFDDESYIMHNPENYIEVDDYNEGNSYL
jgi:hypothetical protein